MLQAEQSSTPPDGHWRILSQLIQNVLSEGTPGTAYGQQLLAVLDRWIKPDTPDPTIGILPRLACEANGGDLRLAAPVTAAWRRSCSTMWKTAR